MARRDVTEAELAVLRQLWDRGPQTIRALTDALYPDGGASAYATVQKLLERLEEKGNAARERGAVPHVFRAIVDRDALLARRLRELADALCDGSVAPLLTSLVAGGKLSRAERARLRQLVDELDAGGRRR
jgi:predicted transcriptional regulator